MVFLAVFIKIFFNYSETKKDLVMWSKVNPQRSEEKLKGELPEWERKLTVEVCFQVNGIV